MSFVHLHVHSCYSFLDGASEPEELACRAAELGFSSLALTDHNSTAGSVKFVAACQQYHIQPILGSEITFYDGSHLTLLAEDTRGYAHLNQLLSLAYEHGGRRTPALPWETLGLYAEGLICLTGCRKGRVPGLVRQNLLEEAEEALWGLLDVFGRGRLYLELQDDWTPDALRVCQGIAALADRLGVGVVATNNVHYAMQEGYVAHDLLRAISAGVRLDTPHPSRPLNRERYLKSAGEMERLFDWCPEALAATEEVAARCSFALPTEDITPRYENGDAAIALREMAYQGARERYGSVSCKVRDRLEHELSVITSLGFADYMLLCRDIVWWARGEQNIRVTGRGSAADSCVAYCLRLTDVDVIARGLPFARFLMPGKTPDIDCDFPSDRRDEVFRHVQARYGKENVGMVCTFFTYHARSAVRDVGKALALPTEVLEFFSERLYHHLGADQIEEAFAKFHELKDHEHMVERCKRLFDLCGRIAGFPRHIGTHSSGLLISRTPLTCLAPLIPSAKGILPIFTLDKCDAEAAGGIKFDVLALRILSSVADAEIDIQRKEPAFSYDDIPLDDEPTYRMLQKGKGIGVFQFESAAQLSLSVELQPECFEDLVAATALIRPSNSSNSNRGTVRASTVRQYLDARSGYERTDCLHPCLRPILERTYGCIIFQEEVDLVVAAMTGWDHPRAERFRKSLAKHTVKGTLAEAGEEFIAACLKHYPRWPKMKAYKLWQQISGWGGYGFTEGHAASFAQIGFKTAYLSVHHAGEFYAGLLNHQPMGFYPPNTLVAEARRRGVDILPVDINASDDKNLAAAEGEIRLGLRLVAKLGEVDRAAILIERKNGGPFHSLLDFCVRVVLKRDRLENLILVGAFDALHPHRRGLLLRLEETLMLAAAYRADMTATGQGALRFGSWQEHPTPCATDIRDFSVWDRFMWTYRITGVCADAHPLSFFRHKIAERGILTVREVLHQGAGASVEVAGLNIRPHRPPTRSGRKVLFSTIEDETGYIQVVVMDDALDRCTATFLLAPAVSVQGRLEHHGKGGVSLRVTDARPLRIFR